MTNLYSDVVALTDVHLGPTADRFVVRQIRSHLQKDPATLSRSELAELIDWIQLAMRHAHDDHAVVDKYVAELRTLANPKNGR